VATVQDSRDECRTRLELYNNRCAATVQGHLQLICHLMPVGNDWDPVLGSPNGTAGTDPPGSHPAPSLRLSEPMFSRTEKMRRQLLEWNVLDHVDPFDWNSCVFCFDNDGQGRTLSILLLFIRMHSGSDQISVRAAGMCAVSGSGMRMRGHLGTCWWWYAIRYQWLVVGRLSGCLAGRFQLMNQLKIKIGWSATEPDHTPSNLTTHSVQMRTPTTKWQDWMPSNRMDSFMEPQPLDLTNN